MGEMKFETAETKIEGRNAVLEALRSGKTVDKLFVLDGCQDGPVRTIIREARKHDTILDFVTKERLDQLSETGRHQGVIARTAVYYYAKVEDSDTVIPVGIFVTDSPKLNEQYYYINKEPVLGFIINSDNVDTAIEFLKYLYIED